MGPPSGVHADHLWECAPGPATRRGDAETTGDGPESAEGPPAAKAGRRRDMTGAAGFLFGPSLLPIAAAFRLGDDPVGEAAASHASHDDERETSASARRTCEAGKLASASMQAITGLRCGEAGPGSASPARSPRRMIPARADIGGRGLLTDPGPSSVGLPRDPGGEWPGPPLIGRSPSRTRSTAVYSG